MQLARSSFRHLTLCLLLAALWGCQTTTTLDSTTQGLPDDPRVTRALELTEAGEYLSAATLYESVAFDAPPVVRARLQLAAADLYLAGGDFDRLRALLQQIRTGELTAAEALQWRLLLAELAMHDGNASEALDLLIELPAPETPLALQQRYHRVAAQAFRMAGNIYESARELQSLDLLIEDELDRFDVQRDILRNLSVLSPSMVSLVRPGLADREAGWIDLAGLIKKYRNQPDLLGEQIAAWRIAHPDHPALPTLLDEFVNDALLPSQLAGEIGILLPEHGTYAGVGAAIREGLIAAWFQTPVPRPRLRFYDSSETASAWRQYTQAVADGAQFVIGPLDKAAVLQFVRAGELPVPVLALNQVRDDTAPPQNLFQFSLAPEDEARQAAEKAWSDGLRRPILLVPDSAWGTRINEAFRERWRALGGETGGWRDYKRGTVDFSEPIRSLLHLDRSEARNRKLAGVIGRKLEFEPRRRGDVDFVFVAAKPKVARQIRPQLQFHHADDLPVYATSHAWNGSIDASLARDVGGMRLPEMPWLVTPDPESPLSRERMAQLFPASATAYGRLYAMGLDAFRLLTALNRLRQSPLETLDGSSGNLYLNALNQVQRQMVWIELQEEPKVLGFSPRLDIQYTPSRGLERGDAPVTLPDITEPAPAPRAGT